MNDLYEAQKTMGEIFQVFGVDWRMLLVQMVNFTVLLGVLWYFLYRPLLAFIDSRREQIIEGVAKAERAEAMLADADAQKASIITKATLDAEQIIGNARDSGRTKEEVMLKLAQEKADRVMMEAKMRAEEAKRQALEESREEIARMVVLGTERLLREKQTETRV